MSSLYLRGQTWWAKTKEQGKVVRWNLKTTSKADAKRSNCLVCQGALVCYASSTSRDCQGVWRFTMAFRIVKSLRMQAVRATFAAFPASRKRS
jgi:hypothetical protein